MWLLLKIEPVDFDRQPVDVVGMTNAYSMLSRINCLINPLGSLAQYG